MSFVKFADHPIINDGIADVRFIGQLECDFGDIDHEQFPQRELEGFTVYNPQLQVQITFGAHDDDDDQYFYFTY